MWFGRDGRRAGEGPQRRWGSEPEGHRAHVARGAGMKLCGFDVTAAGLERAPSAAGDRNPKAVVPTSQEVPA
jgi:hypothetical protein